MYRDPDTVIGDWRYTVRLQETEGLRGVQETRLDVDALLNRLEAHQDRIARVILWHDPLLRLVSKRGEGLLSDLVLDAVSKLMESVPGVLEA